MFANVVVGIDGRNGGRNALALGARLVGEQGRLILAHIFCPDSATWSSSRSTHEASRRRALDMLAAVRADAPSGSEVRMYRANPLRAVRSLIPAASAAVLSDHPASWTRATSSSRPFQTEPRVSVGLHPVPS